MPIDDPQAWAAALGIRGLENFPPSPLAPKILRDWQRAAGQELGDHGDITADCVVNALGVPGRSDPRALAILRGAPAHDASPSARLRTLLQRVRRASE